VSRQAFLINGIRLGTACAGIRQTERDDLAVIEITEDSRLAAVFTQNRFCAAPVMIARTHLHQEEPQWLLINSGNANAGTGSQGYEDCLQTCQLLADKTGVHKEAVLPFSTGVIGERLDVEKFARAIPSALENLDPYGWEKAARAIMTTDTQPKLASATCTIEGQTVSVLGIAKGAGMIRPDMATMLAYVATDAAIEKELLDQWLHEAVDKSFNRITVDGDTSTNDACVLISTGCSGIQVDDLEKERQDEVQQAIEQVFLELAQAIVRDGEGATKFITIEVGGGASSDECLQVAYTIAHSPLVKTAFFASDPNWGRLLAAIGRSGIDDLAITKVSIRLGDVSLIENGEPARDYTEEQGAAVMQQDEITVHVDLGRGEELETLWTCDLSYDYVRINAEYRT